VRFKGGGLHDQAAPDTLVDVKLDFRAWRTFDHQAILGGKPCYDLYRWEPGSGWMTYVGTVFGLDGPVQARKVKDLPKIKPPMQWAREFAMARQGK
jgi:hypothetical protein